MQKTTMQTTEAAAANRKWYLIDATGLTLGHLAVEAANILRGKNKPTFTANVDCGDFLIITNANKVQLSSDKDEREFWYNHSGYIGGLRKRSGKEMIEHFSDELITRSIKGMLPQNKLADRMIVKLFVYKDAGKDHSAQKPIEVKIKKDKK